MMENFRRQFLTEAAGNLRLLAANFQNPEVISGAVRREAFRTLHTIKGTAQTFGFNSTSQLAHQLETLLSINKTGESSAIVSSKSVFLEGIELLIESLEQPDFQIPASYIDKIRELLPKSNLKSATANASSGIPNEIFSQLTNQEKIAAQTAQNDNKKRLFCFEFGYDLMTFADELINFREILNESGEIIATLPGLKPSGDGKINFRILYASAAEMSKIVEIGAAGVATLTFSLSDDFSASEAAGILAQIVRHGKTTAERLGKQIEFELVGDEANLPPEKLKLIFDAALHLVRNSIDHAIEKNGKIKINLENEVNGWRLIVSDDGRGIDLQQIKSKAIEKKLLKIDDILTETELIELIFHAEFSTKTAVTEISGRGVGLDAVKSSIEKAGGTISVKSESGQGATFEVFLPQ